MYLKNCLAYDNQKCIPKNNFLKRSNPKHLLIKSASYDIIVAIIGVHKLHILPRNVMTTLKIGHPTKITVVESSCFVTVNLVVCLLI